LTNATIKQLRQNEIKCVAERQTDTVSMNYKRWLSTFVLSDELRLATIRDLRLRGKITVLLQSIIYSSCYLSDVVKPIHNMQRWVLLRNANKLSVEVAVLLVDK